MPLDPHELSRTPARRDAEHVTIADGHGVTYRPFASLADTEACVVMQREVWGEDFDHVPASLLQVVLHIGGLAIGAFDDHGTLLGFVFSLPGTWHGELIHWSHMLAVRESARDMGIGRKLKEMQRDELARRGIARMMWTFDPLQARNAHLNLNRLGVYVVEYVENMYGITRSPLHHGLATDRLIVSCDTAHAADEPTHDDRHANDGAGAPILSAFSQPGDPVVDRNGRRPPTILLEIPNDFHELVARDPDAARTWREATRRHFMEALRDGYRVSGLLRDRAAARAFYVLRLVPAGAAVRERPRPTHAGNASPLPTNTSPFPHSPHHRSDV